jgi:hypothetical protein
MNDLLSRKKEMKRDYQPGVRVYASQARLHRMQDLLSKKKETKRQCDYQPGFRVVHAGKAAQDAGFVI